VYQGTTFRKGTPLELCELLLKLRESKTRVVFDFGNTKTNKSWEERYDIAGRIGRSTGTQPILILLNKSTSTGGGAISTNCVLSIRESKGKKLIYQHKL
jgi:predicted outer membrane repeat protein